jgi:hypothetical protein
MFASRPTGDSVDAVIVEAGQPELQLHLPLVSVSGAASAVEGFVVAGTGQDGTSATVCTLDIRSGLVETIDLPSEENISDWPVVAGTEPPTVVWVAGSSPSVLYHAVLQEGALTHLGQVLIEGTVWSIETVALPRSTPAVTGPPVGTGVGADVLCHTPVGARLIRLPPPSSNDAPKVGPTEASFPHGARLSAGMVACASSLKELDVWEIPDAVHHSLRLPAPALDGSTLAAAPLVTSDPDLVIWRTLAPDIRSLEDDAGMAQVLVSRGWVAPLDRREWRIGPAVELPIAPGVAETTLGTDLVIADGSTVWIGQPDRASLGQTGP